MLGNCVSCKFCDFSIFSSHSFSGQSHDYMFILCVFFSPRNSARRKGQSPGSSYLCKYACFCYIFTVCFSIGVTPQAQMCLAST